MDGNGLLVEEQRQVQSVNPPGQTRRPTTTHHLVPTLESLTTSHSISFPASSVVLQSSSAVPTSHTRTTRRTSHSSSTRQPASSSSIPAYSSHAPGTFSTRASSSSSTTSVSSATATPLTVDDHHSHGMPPGTIAAAVVVPLLAVAAIIVLAIICLRRKRRSPRPPEIHSQASSGEMTFQPPRDEVGFFGLAKHRTAPTPAAHVHHVITSSHNNAYLSGIGTSIASRSSSPRLDDTRHRRSEGGTFLDPPPPYNPRFRKPLPKTREVEITEGASAGAEADQYLPMPNLGGELVSPSSILGPDDSDCRSPVSPLTSAGHDWSLPASADAAGSLQHPRPNLRRGQSNLSITSTLYSDSASVHSAHAAAPVRVSVISGPSADVSPVEDGTNVRTSWAESDPFIDPSVPRIDGADGTTDREGIT